MTGLATEGRGEATSPPLLLGASRRARPLLTKEGPQNAQPLALLMPKSEKLIVLWTLEPNSWELPTLT